ncbi:MAG: DNA mismatch repair endonuclease MutL [Bacteroidaceae bacterium]|nr:DNA mismatch repair endonuclease MutL [Bacteroidaceae bacterium]
MKDIIQLLPDSVANQIAAGEVVQRPASVVKELMENSVDAGATKVQVIVSDGGRTLIQVIDNGKGMSETDARLAFERHATSKIKCAEDLFSLTTMGFRGEALASIAAVAQVELVTKREADELGTQIVLSGSVLEMQEPVMAPAGSNFKVKNLFYNIPARRKFLKSTQTEFNNIVTEFERVALVNCDVQFSLSHNGSEIVHLPQSSFRQRIVNLFGKKINQQLVEVEVASPLIDMKGFVGMPESARKKGVLQYFFVNGRYMRHPYFAKAVNGAYEDIIPQGEQVPFFLCIDVDPSRIDVNIHPTKTEIKFEDEPSLWKIISAAVRESLGRFNAAPSLGFDDEDMPEIPVMDISGGESAAPVAAPRISYNPQYNPFKNRMPDYRKDSTASWETLYENIGDGKPVDLSPFEDLPIDSQEFSLYGTADEQPIVEEYVPLSQYKGQYILVPVSSGLMWVHQRRAHIRVLYEKYKSQIQERHAVSQGLLFPERVEATLSESVTIENIQEELSYLGFDISSLGGGTFAINGVPAGIAGLSPVKLLMDIVHEVMDQTNSAKSRINESIALSMAKDVAIVVGQVLSFEEMSTLVRDLFQTQAPSLTPDGKTVIHIMQDSDIDHYFFRR